jgi:tetrahydromethanopterin S-methyltransferase subunit G
MKKVTATTKDLEIRTTLLDSGFRDIKKRLDKIEMKLEILASTIDKGIGGWKMILIIFSIATAIASILKIIS